MQFREWLTENAHRTGTKQPNYPEAWDTHPYDYIGVPSFHMPTSADLVTWRTLKVKPYEWESYNKTKNDGEKIVNTWPQITMKPDGWECYNKHWKDYNPHLQTNIQKFSAFAG